MAEEGKRICFVVSPIGEPDSPERNWANKMLKHILTPCANTCGYETRRADQISEQGLITKQVLEHVVRSPMLIADLTFSNPNVFYELAIRHAARRPFVQVIRKGDPRPFDVFNVRTIDVGIDIETADEAKENIINQIKAFQDDATVDSPVSEAMVLGDLRQSGNPQLTEMARLIDEISKVSSGISSLHQRLSEFGEPNELRRLPKAMARYAEDVAEFATEVKYTKYFPSRHSIEHLQRLANEIGLFMEDAGRGEVAADKLERARRQVQDLQAFAHLFIVDIAALEAQARGIIGPQGSQVFEHHGRIRASFPTAPTGPTGGEFEAPRFGGSICKPEIDPPDDAGST